MAQKSRILYVIPEYPVVTQTFVENEAAALERIGYRVTRYPIHVTGSISHRGTKVMTLQRVLASPRRWSAVGATLASLLRNWRSIDSVFRAERLSARDWSRQVFALLHAVAVATYLRSERDAPRFVHAHFLGRCLDVATYVKLLNGAECSTSATGHAGDVTNPASPKRLKEQLVRLDGVVCASSAVAKALKVQSGRSSDGIVHCGIRPAAFGDRGEQVGPLKILSVGRLVEKKGFSDALTAAQRLAESDRDFEWKFVGSGPLSSELLEKSGELVPSGKVSWLGALPSSDVMALLKDWADLFVLPCKPASNGDVDGIPVALMEAMTMRVPVISGRVAGIPELIDSGATGFLIEPGDADGLTECISTLMDNPALRKTFAEGGKKYVDHEFSIDNEAVKLAGLLFSGQKKIC